MAPYVLIVVAQEALRPSIAFRAYTTTMELTKSKEAEIDLSQPPEPDEEFGEALRRANAKLSSNPTDPQTGRPIKMTVSEKGMAKFLKELEEE